MERQNLPVHLGGKLSVDHPSRGDHKKKSRISPKWDENIFGIFDMYWHGVRKLFRHHIAWLNRHIARSVAGGVSHPGPVPGGVAPVQWQARPGGHHAPPHQRGRRGDNLPHGGAVEVGDVEPGAARQRRGQGG